MNESFKDKAWLSEMYLGKGLSCGMIAKLCGTSPETIRRRMKKCGIRLRTCCQARDLRLKRQRQAKNEALLQSILEEDDSAFQHLFEELEALGMGQEGEVWVTQDTVHRKKEEGTTRLKQEVESSFIGSSSPSSVEDQLRAIQAWSERLSKKR